MRELRAYRIIDTEPEPEFDEIVEIACELCAVPIAAVTIIDAEQVWHKSVRGVGDVHVPRSSSVSAVAAARGDLTVIEDLFLDPEFAHCDSVVDEPRLRFFACAILKSPTGHLLGTLCVADTSPRKLSDAQQNLLRFLAQQVMRLLDQRRALHERERLTAAVTQSASNIVLTDPDGRIEWVSRTFEQTTGYQLDEIFGMKPGALLQGPNSSVESIAAMSAAMRDRQNFEGDILNYRSNGEPFFNELIINPVFAEGDRLDGFVSVQRDVTDERRKQIIEQHELKVLDALSSKVSLPEVLSHVTAMIEAIYPEAIGSIHLREGSVLQNGASPGLAEEYLAFTNIIPIEDGSGSCGTAAFRREPVIVEDIADSPLWDGYKDMAAKFGLRACWSFPIFSGQNEVLGTFAAYFREPKTPGPEHHEFLTIAMSLAAVAIEKDRSDKAEAASRRSLQAAKEAAEQASKVKSEFLANVSHEVRTPLTGIVGLLEMLTWTELDDRQRDYVAAIERSADALLSTLNDVLDLAKVEAGVLRLDAQDSDLESLLSDVIKLFEPMAAEKGIQLTAQFAASGPLRVSVDSARFKQIIQNLVSNAIKFTPKGSVRVRLESLEIDGGAQLTLTVADSGIGLTSEQHKHIFEPFMQADTSRTKRYAGAGLGLSIIKGIVDRMGGTITVDSAPDKGSRFIVEVPVKLATATVAEPEAAQVSVTNLSILLVEDNKVNQVVATSMIERLGHHVDVASSGHEAVDKCWRTAYDVVLLDLRMPDMDGFAVAQLIRSPGEELPKILALTADAMTDIRDRCLAEGMDGFIAKPVNVKSLGDAIGRVWRSETTV